MPFIRDTNPKHLAIPPQWWIGALTAFDPDLVVIPSRERPVYLLARRRVLSAGLLPPTAHFQGDAGMLHSHDLVNTGKWFSVDAWSMSGVTALIGHLKSCDTWAADGRMTETDQKRAYFNGSSHAVRRFDEQDQAARQKVDADLRDTLYHASGDAYRALKRRTGSRIAAPGAATTAALSSDIQPSATATGTP